MSIIDPKKNSRKPSVATVSFTIENPDAYQTGPYKKVVHQIEARNAVNKELMRTKALSLWIT
jgi:hypothetical protein